MADDLAAWLTQIWDEMEPNIRMAIRTAEEHVSQFDLDRLAADRQILADYKRLCFDDPFRRTDYFRGQRDALEYAVKHLAEPYADRPGYQEEWRP